MYEQIKNYEVPCPKDGYRLIDGEKRGIEDESVIAHCTNLTHPGFLTKELISRHKCFYKNCPYLRKLPEKPFWQNNKSIFKTQLKRGAVHASRTHKSQQGRNEQKKSDITYLQNEMCGKLKPFIAEWTKDNFQENQFLFVDIRPYENSTTNYRLYYVSSQPCYDAPAYIRLVQIIQQEFNLHIKLVHIKDLDGHYATIEEYNKRKKLR